MKLLSEERDTKESSLNAFSAADGVATMNLYTNAMVSTAASTA